MGLVSGLCQALEGTQLGIVIGVGLARITLSGVPVVLRPFQGNTRLETEERFRLLIGSATNPARDGAVLLGGSGSFIASLITSPLGCSWGLVPCRHVVLDAVSTRSLHLGVRLIYVGRSFIICGKVRSNICGTSNGSFKDTRTP